MWSRDVYLRNAPKVYNRCLNARNFIYLLSFVDNCQLTQEPFSIMIIVVLSYVLLNFHSFFLTIKILANLTWSHSQNIVSWIDNLFSFCVALSVCLYSRVFFWCCPFPSTLKCMGARVAQWVRLNPTTYHQYGVGSRPAL